MTAFRRIDRKRKWSRFASLLVIVSGLTLPASACALSPMRSYTVTLSYAGDSDPARAHNAEIALHQLQAFFDRTLLAPDNDYSFNRDVLGGALPHSLGYMDSAHGFGYGVNIAASALNTLLHKAFFWDERGIERPIFEQVHAVPLKNDTALGVYAVSIYLSSVRAEDYVWRVNPEYHGAPPRITSAVAGMTVSLTVSFSDASAASVSPSTLTNSLRALIGDHRIGVSLLSASDPAVSIQVHDDYQTPIASAWKGPGVIYFFANISPAVWRSVPLRYWKIRNPSEVAPEYQQAWLRYHEILYDVYIMAVFSGNHEAGNVLAYVYRSLPETARKTNPIRAFNEWSQRVVGISAASGLFNWNYGDLENQNLVDDRYAERMLVINNMPLFYANTYSAHDLALFYLYLATNGKTQGFYDTAVELLSIRNEIVSKIEGQAPVDLQTATKDGYFDGGSPQSRGHAVDNDAGLLIFPDGRVYVVAFTAFDAVDLENDVVGLALRALVDDPDLLAGVYL